jgi:hypothetical protein
LVGLHLVSIPGQLLHFNRELSKFNLHQKLSKKAHVKAPKKALQKALINNSIPGMQSETPNDQ